MLGIDVVTEEGNGRENDGSGREWTIGVEGRLITVMEPGSGRVDVG